MNKSVDNAGLDWLRPFEVNDALTTGVLDYARAEQRASTIRHLSTLLVPGILQTEQYMAAVLRLWPSARPLSSASPNKDFAKFRLARQWQLFEKANAPDIQVIIDEVSLTRRVGSPQVMYSQIRHLQKVAKLPNVTLQLLPIATPLSPVSATAALAATLLSFKGEPDVLSTESPDGSLLNSSNANDARMFKMEFINLQSKALSAAKTVKRLDELADSLLEATK